MMKWIEADFIRAFDTEPVRGEHGDQDSYRFDMSQDEFELEVMVWPKRMDVRVTLRHASQDPPVAEVWLHSIVEAQYQSSRGTEALLFMKRIGDHTPAALRVWLHPYFLLAFEDFQAPAVRPLG